MINKSTSLPFMYFYKYFYNLFLNQIKMPSLSTNQSNSQTLNQVVNKGYTLRKIKDKYIKIELRISYNKYSNYQTL